MTVTQLRKQQDPILRKERISPTTARQMLAAMTKRQRPVTQARVKRYAKAMKAGDWLDSGETIKFNNNGELLDGQHRLMAILESGVTMDLLVARGIPDEAFLVIDTGKTRGWSDALAIDGIEHKLAATVGTAAGLALTYKRGEPASGGGRMSNSEIVEFVHANPDLVEAASFVNGVKEHGMLLSAAQLTWICFETRKIDPTEADVFILDFIKGSGLLTADPVLALRSALTADRLSRKRLPMVQLLGSVVKAWNKRRNRQKMAGANTLTRRDWSSFPRFG